MPKQRKRPAKFTTSARVTLAALSVLSFVGGWNIIARQEAPPAEANEPTLPPSPPPVAAVAPLPTPWPTVPPLADMPPVPTLIPTRTYSNVTGVVDGVPDITETTINLAPLPALAPLPTLAPLPEIPAPPPPPPPPPAVNFGGGNQSGGS